LRVGWGDGGDSPQKGSDNADGGHEEMIPLLQVQQRLTNWAGNVWRGGGDWGRGGPWSQNGGNRRPGTNYADKPKAP